MPTTLIALVALLLPALAMAQGDAPAKATALPLTEIAVALGVVLSLLNRFVPAGPDGQKPHWLRLMLDIVSVLPMPGHRGVMGPVNVPGARSRRKPKLAQPDAPPPAALLPLLVLSLLGLVACQGALDKARIATTAAADAGKAAAIFVGDWAEQCQGAAAKIASEEHDVARSREASAKCSADFAIMEKTLRTYQAGIAGVRAGIELSTLTKKFDLGVALRELLQLWRALKGTLEAFGVHLTGVPL